MVLVGEAGLWNAVNSYVRDMPSFKKLKIKLHFFYCNEMEMPVWFIKWYS